MLTQLMLKKLTSSPAWLRLTEDRSAFVFDPDRAEVIKRIFEETIAGIGAHALARRFNELGVPPFGPAPYWQHSTISNILSNRATLGEYTPITWRNRKAVSRGTPVPGYYPAVVDQALFDQAALARRQHIENGRGGQVSNLFPSIMTCAYCGSAMKFENVSARASPGTAGQYYVCSRALKNRECVRLRWPKESFENSFVKFLACASALDEVLFSKLNESANFKSAEDQYLARSTFASAIKQAAIAIRVATIGDTIVDIAIEKCRSRYDCRNLVEPKRSFTVGVAGLRRWRFEPDTANLLPTG